VNWTTRTVARTVVSPLPVSGLRCATSFRKSVYGTEDVDVRHVPTGFAELLTAQTRRVGWGLSVRARHTPRQVGVTTLHGSPNCSHDRALRVLAWLHCRCPCGCRAADATSLQTSLMLFDASRCMKESAPLAWKSKDEMLVASDA